MKGMAILLVDDEPLMRLSMVDALEAVGYDVHAAASGTEGLDVLRQKTVRSGHHRSAAARRGWAHGSQGHERQVARDRGRHDHGPRVGGIRGRCHEAGRL